MKHFGCQRLLQGCFQERVLDGGQTGLAWGSAETLSHTLVNGQRVALLGLKHIELPLLPGVPVTTVQQQPSALCGLFLFPHLLLGLKPELRFIHSRPSTLSPSHPARWKGEGVFSGPHVTHTSPAKDTHRSCHFRYTSRSADSFACNDGWGAKRIKNQRPEFF